MPEIWIDQGDVIVRDGDRSMTLEAFEAAAALPTAQMIRLKIIRKEPKRDQCGEENANSGTERSTKDAS